MRRANFLTYHLQTHHRHLDGESLDLGSEDPSDTFDDEGAKPAAFNDDEIWSAVCGWTKSQSVEEEKMISVLLTSFVKRNFSVGEVFASDLAASVVGRTGRSVRGYVGDFARNRGRFKPYRRGRHRRFSVIDDEECRLKAAEWAREHASVREKPNMTATDFSSFIHRELQPLLNLPAPFLQSISTRTALRFLHSLGFYRKRSSQKRVYMDGQEKLNSFFPYLP